MYQPCTSSIRSANSRKTPAVPTQRWVIKGVDLSRYVWKSWGGQFTAAPVPEGGAGPD